MGALSGIGYVLSDYSLTELAISFALVVLLFTVAKALYRLFLHPLSYYPGPRIAGVTRLWYCYHCYNGTLVHALHKAHKKYGYAIRIAPNELSFSDPAAWDDIYGHRIGKSELVKDPTFYSSISSGPGSIINADRHRHSLLRKQASHGFSERVMRSQEHIIKGYIELMVQRFEECIKNGNPRVDIVDWYNFFTFDVMGDLVFGQSFDCLTNWGYHPWVKLIFDSVKAGSFVRCTKYFPLLSPLAKWLVPRDIRRRRLEQRQIAAEKAAYRKSLGSERQDLISGFLSPGNGITPQEYKSTAETLIIAGSETTATLMSGATYYLLRDTARLAKLQSEIRGAFSSPEEITFTTVNQLPYLLACLNETFRMYPPVPDTFPRNTGPRQEVIAGRVVPPNTTLGVHQWSTYHSPQNFKDPEEFIPERWMDGNKDYESDRREAVQPFHVGPRNCLGRNLAYFEMRLLIARLFWQFDFELSPDSRNWAQQKAFLLWEKPQMFVKISTHHR